MAKKDAMGQEVDSLYLSLGLNVADLEMGFQTAGQTVRQAMSRLNSEANQIRLKADIDVTRLEAAGKSVEALKAREKALNDELAVQQKKLEILNRAYQANAKTYGTDHSLTRGVDTKRLYQLRDIERLKAQIGAVNGELAKTGTASTSALGTLANGFNTVTGKVTGTVGAIGKLNTAITGVVAGITAGAGLFALTDKAMKAGNDLYKLSTRLHTTTAEASQLSKVFQLSGTDINSVIPLFARLDKQALSAAKTQNSLSQAMTEFGFTLTDDKGNLLSYQQQLAQLAKGYQAAVKAGRETEFVTQALGAKGAALVPLLQDYATNMEIVSRIKTTGLLNPKEAHELYIEWQAMQMQAGQLTGAVGQAMMPIAREMMPEITRGFSEFAQLIKENQSSIKEFGSVAGNAIGGIATALVEVVSLLGKVKEGIDKVGASAEDWEVLKKINPTGTQILRPLVDGSAALAGGIAGGSRFGWKGAVGGAYASGSAADEILGRIGKWAVGSDEFEAIKMRQQLLKEEQESFKKFNEERRKEREEENRSIAESVKMEKEATQVKTELQDQLAKATSQKLKEQLEAIKDKVDESVRQGKTEAAAWVAVADDIKKAMKDAAKEAREANKALDRSIYRLSHSDYENSLKDIEYSAEDTLKKGADPARVAREAELKRQKVIEDSARETAQYLDSVYEDSLTQRLRQIERERKAWIKKGMDEVTATRAAEQQKKQAVNDSVKSMFTSQKKYLALYRNAMAGNISADGSGFYDFTQSQGDRQKNAIRAIQRAMMAEAGVSPNERTSMAEIMGFQKAMKEANNWGSGLISDGTANGISELSNVLAQNNEQTIDILGQINSQVPEVNTNLSAILGAIEQRSQSAPEINVSPSINVNLGGAYVFDNAMKQRLTDDITNNVANAVTSAVNEATSRINTGFGN
ncbi:hypothetical protein [Selenomonas ruminantium]|uniref:hypothetical protein n=1 Tax=Selenomonas ruminantium TaxID=971 RepID=UPI0026EB5F16|nr:hypothetical protein [Selenomonas ruminantium]